MIWKIVFYLPQSINPINLEENWPISIHSSILFHIEVMSWQWHDWCHFTQLRLGALIDSLQKTLDRSIHLVTFWWLCQPIFFILLSFDTACRYYNMRTKTFMVASCELLWSQIGIRSKFVQFDSKICDSIDSKGQKIFEKFDEN